MTLRYWIRKLFVRKPRTIRKEPIRIRPRLEALEDRTLLSGDLFTTGDLIAAIQNANTSGSATTLYLASNNAIFDFTSAYNSTPNALPIITGNITIVGNGQTIERTGGPAFRLFDVASGGSLTLENMTLTGGLAQGSGSAADGGAIYNSGNLALSGVAVKSNKAVGNSGGRTPGSLNGNVGASAGGGGLYVAGGTVTLSNDTLSGNGAQGGNGGNGNFDSQHVGGYGGTGGFGSGGGLFVAGGFVALNNDTFSSNMAQGGAGGHGGIGLPTGPPGGPGFKIGRGGGGGTGGTGAGGGVYVTAGTVTLSDGTLSANQAKGGNGGSGGSGSPVGLAGVGGLGAGGGLYVAGGSATLSNDTLNGDNADGGSGGTGGSAAGVSATGGTGGLGAGGGLVMASKYFETGAGTLLLGNDTVSGNYVVGGYGGNGGGATYGGEGGNGGGAVGGGLDILGGSTAILANTIIAQDNLFLRPGGAGGFGFTGSGASGSYGSASNPDVSGTVQSSDHDLIGDGAGFRATTSNGDQVGTASNPINPLLGSLQNNGGPTQSMALLAGSPAIDAGDNSAVPDAIDQRGYARIVGNAVDIGAYEYAATAATTDLSVRGKAPSTAAFGGQITYTLTVTNDNSSAQSNITLADVLPANTALVSWTVPSGWSSSAPAAGSSGTVSAWITSLTTNTSATFSLVVQLNSSAAAGTVISNKASVGPITGDPTPSNNSASFQTTVTQATPTVTVKPVNITYGTALANTQLSGSATSTVDGNTVTVAGTFTYTSAAETVLGAGNDQSEAVSFTPSDTTDYATVQTTATINVVPASLTVMADNLSMTYGGSVPPLTYHYSGLVNGDTSAAFAGALATSATSSSNVSGYAISQGNLAATGNYTIATFNAGTLTVNPAQLTIDPTSSAPSRLRIGVASVVVFRETFDHKEVSHEQEIHCPPDG